MTSENSTCPILVCDIDDTVTAGGGWRLVYSTGTSIRPLPGAPQVLERLALQFRVVFLTARDDAHLNDTRDWLARQGFPSAPVVCRDWEIGNLSQAGEFKTKVLEDLSRRFKNIVWGIGNSEGDCQAYRASGIPHLTLDVSHCPRDNSISCRAVRDWTEIGTIFRKETGK